MSINLRAIGWKPLAVVLHRGLSCSLSQVMDNHIAIFSHYLMVYRNPDIWLLTIGPSAERSSYVRVLCALLVGGRDAARLRQ